MKWFVLYTKPRTERKTAQELEKIGIQVYCPLVTKFRQWSDRTKKVKTPLFNSYVFVYLGEKDRKKVFEVPTVIRYLTWLGKPASVKDKEIETLKDWLESEKYQDIQVHNISPGDTVTITNGALKGKAGIVQEIGRKEVKLVLTSLGFIVTTNIKDVS